MLSESQIYDVLRESLRVLLIISAPVLFSGFAAGLLIGLFQALTTIQEMTLTFVPKLGVMFVAFWISMELSLRSLRNLFDTVIIPKIGGI